MKFGKTIIIGLFLLVSIQFFWTSFNRLSRGPSQDFEVFWLAGKQVWQGQNPYLKLAGDTVRNPPPALFLFAPLGLLPIHTAEVSYFIISFGAFLLASYFLFKIVAHRFFITTPGSRCSRTAGPEYPRQIFNTWQGKIIYLTLAILFFPLRHNLASGQANTFLLLLLAAAFYFYLKKKDLLLALMLALAISLKLTPLVFLFLLLIQKRFRAIWQTGFWLLVLTFFTTLTFGPQIWSDYLKVSGSFFDLSTSRYYNQALTGLANRIYPQMTSIVYLFSVILVGVIFLRFYHRLQAKDFQTTTILWNLSILGMLLFAPFAWQYHFTIAIFPLFTSTYLAWEERKLNRKPHSEFISGSSIVPLLTVGLSYLLLAGNLKNPSFFDQWGIAGAIITSHATLGTLLLSLLNLHFLTKS